MPLCGNTQRSRGTPRASARSAEQRITAALCSTALFEFIRFVYGKPIILLSALGVRISSGE